MSNSTRLAALSILMGLTLVVCPALTLSADDVLSPATVRAAASKALALIRSSAAEYQRQRQCFSCHHQALSAMAGRVAWQHGIDTAPQGKLSEAQFTHDYYLGRSEQLIAGQGAPGGPYSAGYALRTLHDAAWSDRAAADALVQFLRKRQRDDGAWHIQTHRPPLEDSHFTATALAVQGLMTQPRRDAADVQRVERAQAWLLVTQPQHTEDAAFRLLGLTWSLAENEDLREAAQPLKESQRDDGSWSQTKDLDGDAYATGLALVALAESGQLKTNDAAYQRGLAYLLKTQHTDGSWLVTSRSKPFQTYFESGFPHSKHQFISIAASAWSSMALALALPLTADPAVLDRVSVFTARQHDYHTFRIPAIVRSKLGTLLAFAEGRKEAGNDTGNIDTVLRRSTDGGLTWGPLQVVADEADNTIGNPSPVVDDKSGTIFLLLTRNLGSDKQTAIELGTSQQPRTVWLTSSTDDGQSWSPLAEISATTRDPHWGWYGTGPGNGIQLSSGRLVVPCHHSLRKSHEQAAHVIYSDDQGRSWHLGGSTASGGGESAVAELHDGSLLMSMRPHPKGEGQRLHSLSRDQGLTWSALEKQPALVDPGCQGSLIRSGDRLVFSNPAHASKREQMTLRVSRDDGRSWIARHLIDTRPAAYSCLVTLPDDVVGCLYECGHARAYETIAFARVRIE